MHSKLNLSESLRVNVDLICPLRIIVLTRLLTNRLRYSDIVFVQTLGVPVPHRKGFERLPLLPVERAYQVNTYFINSVLQCGACFYN